MELALILRNLHNRAILGSTPEEKGHIWRCGQSLDTASMSTEHMCGLLGIQVVHTNLTICSPTDY